MFNHWTVYHEIVVNGIVLYTAMFLGVRLIDNLCDFFSMPDDIRAEGKNVVLYTSPLLAILLIVLTATSGEF